MMPNLPLSSSASQITSDPLFHAKRRLQSLVLRTTKEDPTIGLNTGTPPHGWVVPASIVGGTVVCYSAILQQQSQTIAPLSFLYMILLALQYTVQPKLSKRYIHADISKDKVALVEESVKTVVAGIIFCVSPKSSWKQQMDQFTWRSSLWIAGLPATLYALQGVLQYISYENLDAVTFNGIAQTKTITAAFFCYLLLGKPQSRMQMMALCLLVVSTIVFQHQSLSTQRRSVKNRSRMLSGVLPCLGATVLSGLAGALSQKGLQMTTAVGPRDAFFFTTEVSLYSALVLTLSNLFRTIFNHGTAAPKSERSKQYWTYQTWIPIVTKAAGGILTALVHQTSGSVQKGFALVLGLVLIGRLSDRPNHWQNVATLMVLLSAYLHFTNPPILMS